MNIPTRILQPSTIIHNPSTSESLNPYTRTPPDLQKKHEPMHPTPLNPKTHQLSKLSNGQLKCRRMRREPHTVIDDPQTLTPAHP